MGLRSQKKGETIWKQRGQIDELTAEVTRLRDLLVASGIEPGAPARVRTAFTTEPAEPPPHSVTLTNVGMHQRKLRRGYTDSMLLGRVKNKRPRASSDGHVDDAPAALLRPSSARSDIGESQSAAEAARKEIMIRSMQQQLVHLRGISAGLQGELQV